MLVAVVPAQNEAGRITRVLHHLRTIGTDTDIILPVINGSRDNTRAEIEALAWPQVRIIHFAESLGIDVPRAVGAKVARDLGATCVLFIDGDMVGDLAGPLEDLKVTIMTGADLALTNCYPFFTRHSRLASLVLAFRRKLNQACGLAERIGLASPSHGPTAVSRRFLFEVPLPALAIPPVGMVLAHQAGLKIQVATAVPHAKLGSAIKDEHHAELVAATIIGDCLEALRIYQGLPPSRSFLGREFLGYHPVRRWDLLLQFLAQ